MSNYNTALNLDIEFHIVHCGNCGGTYALNKEYVNQKRQEGGFWHCPYCQTGWGYGESEIDRMKKRLESATRQSTRLADELGHTQRQLRAQKGQTTRIKNRVGKGVCPCCNRTFQNLGKHMQKQHPEFIEP